MKDSTLDGAAEYLIRRLRDRVHVDERLMEQAADMIEDLAKRNKELLFLIAAAEKDAA